MENMQKWFWLTLYSLIWALVIQAAYDILKETLKISPGFAALGVALPILAVLYWKRPKTWKK